MKPIRNFRPYGGIFQALLHLLFDLPFREDPQYPQAKSNIFKDTFRKGIWSLEDHSYPFSERDHIGPRLVNILPVKRHPSFGSSMRNQFIHPVGGPGTSRL